jgi:hypothetical protein
VRPQIRPVHAFRMSLRKSFLQISPEHVLQLPVSEVFE